MRRPIGSPPAQGGVEAKVDWLIKAVQALSRATYDMDSFAISDGFAVENLTESRSLDCDTATVAQLSDVVGTLLQDHKRRGSKKS
ncbi:MAG: hypothetical protein ACRECF_06985 [Methyloceanibacter sp.]